MAKSQINMILENDWYKTASKEDMRVALMHVEMNASDRTISELCEKQKEVRNSMFESCSSANNWDEKSKG